MQWPPSNTLCKVSRERDKDRQGEVKKRQQAIVGFLEANRISFEEVDITMLEDQRLWMYQNIPEEKRPEKGNPLPPQIFSGDDYCGDYEDFFQSKETNTVFSFLRLPPVKDSES
ncbi:SH3 domain-binding glutamic acid-rich-like protein 2 isoform X1 [Garra rufa]|uniref:SH3 domain-binding glutamic acid-rich-like protein 2 isoform X1 n=1 Tax=Garra rufa TaxID=137080 RepID=UPI003CCE5C69